MAASAMVKQLYSQHLQTLHILFVLVVTSCPQQRHRKKSRGVSCKGCVGERRTCKSEGIT